MSEQAVEEMEQSSSSHPSDAKDVVMQELQSVEDRQKAQIGYLQHSLGLQGKGLREAERRIAFTDAAVAIAMTLLIVPLMEYVVEAGIEAAKSGESVSVESPLWPQYIRLCHVLCPHCTLLGQTRRTVSLFVEVLQANDARELGLALVLGVHSGEHQFGFERLVQHRECAAVCSCPCSCSVHQLPFLVLAMISPGAWKEEESRPPSILITSAIIDVVLTGVAVGLCFTVVGAWGVWLLAIAKYLRTFVEYKWPDFLERNDQA